MQSTTTVVLGGGVGGMVAANEIRRQLPAAHQVLLVEKNAQHAFAPSFLWVMTGDREPEQIRRPSASLLRRGVEFVQAEVIGIDSAIRKVRTSAAEIAYDRLVVALGADLAPEAIPGLASASHTFFTFDGAVSLRDALETFSSRLLKNGDRQPPLAGREITRAAMTDDERLTKSVSVPFFPQPRAGRIAVVVSAMPYKCPGAPHEGAMLIADYFRRRGLSAKVEIHLFTPESQPMPVAGPQLGEAVRGMLRAKGIEFHPLHKLDGVDPSARRLAFDNGEQFDYDLLVAVPPHRAPKAVVDAGLTNQAGWIPVDPHTLETNQRGVYAIGDVTAIPIPGRWKPDVPLMLPKAGVFAHAQAEVVAQRIVADIAGRPSQAAFCGDGYCMLEAGEDLAGFAFGNFFAQPAPNVQLRQIGKAWHLGKVLFEKWWLAPVGFRRSLIGWVVKAGGRFYGIPITL